MNMLIEVRALQEKLNGLEARIEKLEARIEKLEGRKVREDEITQKVTVPDPSYQKHGRGHG